MLQELHAPAVPPSRWKPDENYDSKPVDLEYFKKYVKNQEELKTPYKCPDCRHTNIIKPTFVSGTDAIHSKRQTFSWMNMFNENVVEFPPQLQKIQQATLAQELFKQMPP